MKKYKAIILVVLVVSILILTIAIVRPNYLSKVSGMLRNALNVTSSGKSQNKDFVGLVINSARTSDTRILMVYNEVERKPMQFQVPLDLYVDNVVSVDKLDNKIDPIAMKGTSNSYISDVKLGDYVRVSYKVEKEKNLAVSVKRNNTGMYDGFVLGKVASVSADKLDVIEGNNKYKFIIGKSLKISSKVREVPMDNLIVAVPAEAEETLSFLPTIIVGNTVSVSYEGMPQNNSVAKSVLILTR